MIVLTVKKKYPMRKKCCHATSPPIVSYSPCHQLSCPLPGIRPILDSDAATTPNFISSKFIKGNSASTSVFFVSVQPCVCVQLFVWYEVQLCVRLARTTLRTRSRDSVVGARRCESTRHKSPRGDTTFQTEGDYRPFVFISYTHLRAREALIIFTRKRSR